MINELPVDVGMSGQIRHKGKINLLNLGAERVSQSDKVFACASFSSCYHNSGSWMLLINSETGRLCHLPAYMGSN